MGLPEWSGWLLCVGIPSYAKRKPSTIDGTTSVCLAETNELGELKQSTRQAYRGVYRCVQQQVKQSLGNAGNSSYASPPNAGRPMEKSPVGEALFLYKTLSPGRNYGGSETVQSLPVPEVVPDIAGCRKYAPEPLSRRKGFSHTHIRTHTRITSAAALAYKKR